METNRPREWWIDPEPCDEDMPSVVDAFSEHPGQGPLQWQASLLHVVEKSAYDALKAELEQAKAQLNNMSWSPRKDTDCGQYTAMSIERWDELKAELEQAKADYVRIENHWRDSIKEFQAEIERLKAERTKTTARGGVAYLWFDGKNGWQVTSFHPSEDPAIGWPRGKETRMYVNYDEHLRVKEIAESLTAKCTKYREALEWIMPKVHQGNHEGDFEQCPKATCVAYRQALEDGE